MPKVCMCMQIPPNPTNIDVIINLLNSGTLQLVILFTPFVTSKMPEIIPLDKFVGTFGISIFAIKLVICNFSKIVEIIENINIKPPTVQIVEMEFFIVLLKIEPSSLIFIILKLSLGFEVLLVFFLNSP